MITRRRFVRTAAGAASAAVGLSSIHGVSAQPSSLGQITLDALLISYFSAAIGSTGIPLWSLSGSYANTIRIKEEDPPEVTLRARPDPDDRFIFAGHQIEQIRSGELNNGMIMRHKGFSGTKFGFGREEDVHTREDTVFFSIFRPRLEITGNPQKPRFRFIGDETGNGGALFPVSLRELQDPSFGFIRQSTSDSWKQIYVTDPALLTGPRFRLKATTDLVSAGTGIPFNLREKGDSQFSSARTAVTSSTVVAQTGFTDEELTRRFAVGNRIKITHTSLQEIEAPDAVRMEVTISRAERGVTNIYRDRVFKTFVIVDAGEET